MLGQAKVSALPCSADTEALHSVGGREEAWPQLSTQDPALFWCKLRGRGRDSRDWDLGEELAGHQPEISAPTKHSLAVPHQAGRLEVREMLSTASEGGSQLVATPRALMCGVTQYRLLHLEAKP